MKEKKSNWERDDEDNDEDDRKPPAKEVVVINNRQDRENGRSPRSTEDTEETSIVSSNASCSASTPGVAAAATGATAATCDYSPTTSSPSSSPAAASPTTATAGAAYMTPSSILTTSNLKKPQQQQQQSMSSFIERIRDQTGASISTNNAVMNMSNILVRLMQSSSREQQLVVLLMTTTVLSTAAFIVCILPMTALIAMSIGTASFGLLLQQAFYLVLQEYNFRVEHGRGLSEFFSTSLLQTLTRTTLHEYMVDDSFAIEYRYLLLYFIPGISPQQLQAYIDRLEPRHRDLLRRPGGIGQLLLGPAGMRALIGQHEWDLLQQQAQQQQQQQQQGQQTPTLQQQQPQASPMIQLLEMQDRQAMESATPARTLFHRDDEDDSSSSSSCSDLGLDVTANDLVGGLSESQATRMARQLGLMTPTPMTTAPNDTTAATAAVVVPTSTSTPGAAEEQEERERAISLLYQQEEEAVVTEAFWSSYYYFYDMALGAVRGAIVPSRRTVVRSSIIGVGVGITVPTAVAAIYNFWASSGGMSAFSARAASVRSSSSFIVFSRFWSPRGNDNNGRSSLWTTVLLGSGVAGVVLYATTAAYSRSSLSSTESDEKTKKTENWSNHQSKK